MLLALGSLTAACMASTWADNSRSCCGCHPGRRMKAECGVQKPKTKPAKATTTPTASNCQPITALKPPTSHLQAIYMGVASHPQATPMRPSCVPQATLGQRMTAECGMQMAGQNHPRARGLGAASQGGRCLSVAPLPEPPNSGVGVSPAIRASLEISTAGERPGAAGETPAPLLRRPVQGAKRVK